MHVLVIFIFVTAEYHHKIVGASGVCEPLIQENNTIHVDSTSRPVNSKIRTPCKEGFLRKPGTSTMYHCIKERDGKLRWKNDLKLVCIPDPRIPTVRPTTKSPVTMATEMPSSTWSTSSQNTTTRSPPTQSSTLSTTTDAPRTELNLTTSTPQKISTFCVTGMPTTEATNEGTTTKTRTNPPTESSVTMTIKIPSSTRSTSSQNTTTRSPPTQSSKTSTTTGSGPEPNVDPQYARNTSITGVTAGIILVCLVSAAAAAVLTHYTSKRRATNRANEIQLDHANYPTCITYIPVPVSEHCSAEPSDIDVIANKSTTDSQTE
ncbi:interleukin-15 receptor subunit alpha isoform X2 [Paramisgurnus dabryanus]|uniref:interleukin-15 receptor subunit alpha isoform X2 n=1 Tax=Paramisgurnus dabryanus TaxID=90735 RepID=UPI0031F33A9A